MKKLFIEKLMLIVPLLISSFAYTENNRDPEALFNSFCFSCHGTGWEDAPVIGDSYAWEERLEQGINVLIKHTVEGFNSMPPKGGCGNCTVEELKTVILWMSE
ncbi:MAG: c-type cytochrome [Cellvibrionaceae bacterium]